MIDRETTFGKNNCESTIHLRQTNLSSAVVVKTIGFGHASSVNRVTLTVITACCRSHSKVVSEACRASAALRCVPLNNRTRSCYSTAAESTISIRSVNGVQQAESNSRPNSLSTKTSTLENLHNKILPAIHSNVFEVA